MQLAKDPDASSRRIRNTALKHAIQCFAERLIHALEFIVDTKRTAINNHERIHRLLFQDGYYKYVSACKETFNCRFDKHGFGDSTREYFSLKSLLYGEYAIDRDESETVIGILKIKAAELPRVPRIILSDSSKSPVYVSVRWNPVDA